MMSVITTQESQTTLARRLAAWCVVEADQQRFNFRFPDTRRLPCIYAALTEQQRQQMTGPAAEWSYIARDGTWEHLSLIPGITSIHNDVPKLTAQQFAALVADSEGDEIASMLHYRGVMTTEDPYLHHLIISEALKVSRSSSLNAQDKLDWCESCILERQLLSTPKIISKFSSWKKARLTNN
ncbi:hypothetical protein ASF61_15880 [Duganella sp. Leaf126]|nr:hypothetical protein ASF61_15880 [Duganella sp. Leaf126]